MVEDSNWMIIEFPTPRACRSRDVTHLYCRKASLLSYLRVQTFGMVLSLPTCSVWLSQAIKKNLCLEHPSYGLKRPKDVLGRSIDNVGN